MREECGWEFVILSLILFRIKRMNVRLGGVEVLKMGSSSWQTFVISRREFLSTLSNPDSSSSVKSVRRIRGPKKSSMQNPSYILPS